MFFDNLNLREFFDKRSMATDNMPMANKHARFWWALYDFGNSLAIIVFYVFFPLWFVKVKGGTDQMYNWAFILSSVLFLIFAPYLGNLADKNRSYLKGLFWSTSATGLCYIAVSIATLIPQSPTWLCFILFTVAFFLYQLTFVYYTPLLKYLSTGENKKQSLETNSGIGQSANYLGQVVGLVIALPFIKGAVSVFGNTSVSAPFLPLTCLFLIIALWSLYKINTSLKDVVSLSASVETEQSQAPQTMFKEVKNLFMIGGVGIFFITYFLISDAVLTLSGNYSLYLTNLFPSTTSSHITYITVGILTMSALGAYICGKVSHKVGSYRTLMTILGSWVAILIGLIFAQGFGAHLTLFLLAGFFLGPVWVVSRVILIERVPVSKLGIASSVYTLAERFSTFIGPLFWSASLSIFATTGQTKYKYAVGSLLIVVLIAVLLWRKEKQRLISI